MTSIRFDPNDFGSLAHELMRTQQTEAAIRTAISRVYYSAYLKALYYLFPDGNVPRAAAETQLKNRRGSHAVVIQRIFTMRRALGDKLYTLQQLRVQADYKLIPDQRFVSWTDNWRQAQALEAEINRGYAEVGIQI